MAPKHVPPAINRKSFSCPHCGAMADQAWFDTYANSTKDDALPGITTRQLVEDLEKDPDFANHPVLESFRLSAQGHPKLIPMTESHWARMNLENIFVSQCYSCKDITIWKHDAILYPPTRYEIEPNADMPDDVSADFDEARAVLGTSPRAAAALLRLCVQKLCKHLDEPGENLNADIGSLSKKGLHADVCKALDIVRVIGNNAVHPGQIDLRDETITAQKLFVLVNRIAQDMISYKKEIDALLDEKVPVGAKAQIARRDGTN